MSGHAGAPGGNSGDAVSRKSCWPRAYWVAGLAALLGVALVAALHTQGKLIRVGWYPLAIWLLMPGLMAWMWGQTGSAGARLLRRWWPLLVLTGVLLLLLFSSATFHRWFFFMRWEPVAKVGAGGLARFVWLAALFTPLYAIGHRRRWAWILPLLVLIGFEWLCIQTIFAQTGGRAIYRTDHPSFMFRIWEFSRNFPQLVSYLPNWNGGIVHISSVASGTAAPTLVLLPLFRYFPVHEIYTAAWTLLFLVVIPWIGVYSTRVIGGSWTSAFTAGVLALGLSQHFYLWALHFGTIGATFTAAMTMPVCALGYRIVHLGRIRPSIIVGFVVSGFLLLVWPPGGLVAGGAVLSTLLAARRWTRRKVRVLALAGACILLLYSPWLYAILVQARSVVDFITTPAEVAPAAEEAATFSWAAWWAVVRPALMRGVMMLKWQTLEINPLIVVFGLLGVLAGVDRRLRSWYLPIYLVLALITGWAKEFLPHSQMSRMAIPLAFAAVVPAALFVGRLLRLDDRRLAGVRAIMLAALITTGMTVLRICGNHGLAKYVAMGEQVDTLVAWLKENTPADGRILFAGKCVHYYGKGNVAYLSVLAEREMMAVDYYGFPPEQVLYEYPPRPFRKTPELLQTFFNSYNVSHLVTYHEDWKGHFRAEPALYKELISFDRTTIFERTSRPGMFLQGSGRVKASPNRITITLDDPQAPAVVAYNWANGWRAPAPVTIHPHTVVEGLVLIGIEPNGQREFTLEYHSKGDVPDA